MHKKTIKEFAKILDGFYSFINVEEQHYLRQIA